jgi:NitT/TauT family transport system ATP-binding protein
MDMSALISLRGVSMVFNEQAAVDNLSLSVEPGEVLALLGQTGAGKSTVLNLILGQIRPTAGTVIVDGHDPYADTEALRGRMAVSFQTDRLLPWRTALRNVELGLEILRRSRDRRATLAADWLMRVKLDQVHHGKFPHQLSGGMRQRVSLARALVIDPDLVLLDESFSQLDHVTSSALRRDFLSLVKEYRKTCVLITHRIDDALEMADRIIVLAAPARIVSELLIDPAERRREDWLVATSRRITREMAALSSPIDSPADTGATLSP